MQTAETSFCICLWSRLIIKSGLSFITCLYFPLALIWWYSNYCNLMELFKTKKTFKEKVDSNNNWNCMTKNDFRVTSIFKVIIRICMKNVEFCGKTSKLLSKRCLFISFIFFIFLFFFNSKIPERLSLVH